MRYILGVVERVHMKKVRTKPKSDNHVPGATSRICLLYPRQNPFAHSDQLPDSCSLCISIDYMYDAARL